VCNCSCSNSRNYTCGFDYRAIVSRQLYFPHRRDYKEEDLKKKNLRQKAGGRIRFLKTKGNKDRRSRAGLLDVNQEAAKRRDSLTRTRVMDPASGQKLPMIAESPPPIRLAQGFGAQGAPAGF
jgi:hypothetical protein